MEATLLLSAREAFQSREDCGAPGSGKGISRSSPRGLKVARSSDFFQENLGS